MVYREKPHIIMTCLGSEIVDGVSLFLDPVRFSLAQSVYVVEEGETARVCLEAAENDLPLIRFHLIVLDLGGNATGLFLSFIVSLISRGRKKSALESS